MRDRNITQEVAVLTHLTPGSSALAAGSSASPAFDASRFQRVKALLQIGTLAGAGTVNIRFQHNSTSVSSHSAWADVNSACVGSTFTSAKNGLLSQLELKLDQQPLVSRYVRAVATVAVSTWLAGGVVVEGIGSVFEPASQFNTTDVQESVVY